MIVKEKSTGHEWRVQVSLLANDPEKSDYLLTRPLGAGTIQVTGYGLIRAFDPVGVIVLDKDSQGRKIRVVGEALYGVISAMGDTWSVMFRREQKEDFGEVWWKITELNGYGDFPFERFPEIPVVDFSGNNMVYDISSRNLLVSEVKWDQTGLGIWTYISLLSYLDRCVTGQIPVYRLTHEHEKDVK